MDKTKVLDDIRTQELINWIKGTFLNKNEDISLSSDEIDDIIDNAIEEAEEEVYGTKVAVPTFTATIYYDGTEKTAVFNGYDPNKMTVTGNTATNVGNYTATFTLKQGFQWVDETTAPKEVAWSIQAEPVKTQLTVPTFTSTITYDGTEKTATFTGYDSETMTVSGNTGTNAGTYTATFGIKDKSQYEWSDGTSADKTVTWTIGKATGSITLDKNSISLDDTTTSDTVTATIVGDGTLTATSSDSTVATVTKNGNTFTVSSVGNTGGTATITFSLAAGTNYTGASDQTVSVSASFGATITLGQEYTINGKTFIAAEDLGNGKYAMQANQSWATGSWPGYRANNNQVSDNNFEFQSVAPYYTEANTWYNNDVKYIEDQTHKYGPYLVSAEKCGINGTGQIGSGYYYRGLADACNHQDCYGSWLGTIFGTVSWAENEIYVFYSTNSGGQSYHMPQNQAETDLAPAFNIDTSKIEIDSNNVITKK